MPVFESLDHLQKLIVTNSYPNRHCKHMNQSGLVDVCELVTIKHHDQEVHGLFTTGVYHCQFRIREIL